MKFTVIFPSSEASDATVGITFKSSLVWVEGSRDLLNPHPENPHYLKGDLRRFFEETNFDVENISMMDIDKEKIKKVTRDYKLKRTKPLPDFKNTLESSMKLKYV